MATKKLNKYVPAGSDQDIRPVIAANLKYLIEHNHTTQKELADALGVVPASMTDYCNGVRVPSITVLAGLKNLYDINIDDFISKSIQPSKKNKKTPNYVIDANLLDTYERYCGLYYVYYLDTGRYKGRDTLLPKDSLKFGILYIYKTLSSLSLPEFSCAAVMGIDSRDEAVSLRSALESICGDSRQNRSAEAVKYIESHHAGTAYFGDFELSPEYAFISISHVNTDRALLIFHRVDNNKRNYTGGIGTINSVSRGRERAAVVQFMGISRYALDMSAEEIHHSLLLNYPSFSAEAETEELIRNFKSLYLDDGDAKALSEYQKSVIVRSTLERFVKKSLERNMFRYGKVSERDDDAWYHAIKNSSPRESE